jgi:hypothetical protein
MRRIILIGTLLIVGCAPVELGRYDPIHICADETRSVDIINKTLNDCGSLERIRTIATLYTIEGYCPADSITAQIEAKDPLELGEEVSYFEMTAQNELIRGKIQGEPWRLMLTDKADKAIVIHCYNNN